MSDARNGAEHAGAPATETTGTKNVGRSQTTGTGRSETLEPTDTTGTGTPAGRHRADRGSDTGELGGSSSIGETDSAQPPNVPANVTVVPGSGERAGRLLLRISRHTPLRPGRVVVALVQRRRGYVTATGWTRADDLEIDPADPPIGLAEQDLRIRVQHTLERLDLPARARRTAYALVVARCRSGRVVWLPADLAWVDAITELAGRVRLDVLDSFLVTEHGWRGGDGTGGDHEPSLAA